MQRKYVNPILIHGSTLTHTQKKPNKYCFGRQILHTGYISCIFCIQSKNELMQCPIFYILGEDPNQGRGISGYCITFNVSRLLHSLKIILDVDISKFRILQVPWRGKEPQYWMLCILNSLNHQPQDVTPSPCRNLPVNQQWPHFPQNIQSRNAFGIIISSNN